MAAPLEPSGLGRAKKNGAAGRRIVGCRYQGFEAATVLARLYRVTRLYVNHLQPSFKLAEKEREGAKVRKRYHAPDTPVARLTADARTPPAMRRRVETLHATLDPLPAAGRVGRLGRPARQGG